MITEKEYREAQMIIKLYESQQFNISGVIVSVCDGCVNKKMDMDDYPCSCCRDGNKKQTEL